MIFASGLSLEGPTPVTARRVRVVRTGDDDDRGSVDTILNHWTVTIFLPAILIGLAILVAIIRVVEKR